MREASQMIDMAHMLTAVLYIQLIHNIIFEHIVQEIFFMPNKCMITNFVGIYTFNLDIEILTGFQYFCFISLFAYTVKSIWQYIYFVFSRLLLVSISRRMRRIELCMSHFLGINYTPRKYFSFMLTQRKDINILLPQKSKMSA